MSSNKVSVWEYYKKCKDAAICKLCSKSSKSSGGTTTSLWKHLRTQHTIVLTSTATEVNSVDNSDNSYYDKEAEQPKRSRISQAIANMGSDAAVPVPLACSSFSSRQFISPETISSQTPSTSYSLGNSENKESDPEIIIEKTFAQQKITSMFMKPSQLQKRSEQITQRIVSMIAEDMLPLHFVEHSGFKNLMKFLNPQYQVPCRNTIRSRLLLQHNNAKVNLKIFLNSFEYVALTTDNWTSRNNTSYITVTAHAITEEWKPFSCTLVTEQMPERHTAENIKDRLQNIIEEWSLTNKVCAVVHDNAKNITKAIKLNRISFGDYVPCFAHTLQLCINDSLTASPLTTALLELCRKIVSHFHRSNVATEALKEKQDLFSVTKHKLIQSVTTRWNSTYYMLDRLYEQRQAIIAVLADRSVTSSKTATSLETTELDWINISKLLEILKPFEVSTKLLCSEKNITLSVAKPLMQSLLDNFLKENEEDANYEIIVKVKEVIRNEIQERFNLHPENVNLSMFDTCSLLDPRFINSVNVNTKQLGMQYIELLEKRIIVSNNDSDANPTEKESAISFLFPKQEVISDKHISETKRYFDETPLNKNGDVYKWWRDKEGKYPRLSKIAKKYLSIPATSAPSERVFSTAGNIVTNKRNCLLPENVDMLVFLYENKNNVYGFSE